MLNFQIDLGHKWNKFKCFQEIDGVIFEGEDFDMMIEAKQKDLAMIKLVEDIAAIRGVKRITSSVVEW